MTAAPAASIVDVLLGLALGPVDPGAGNRFSVEGLASGRGPDGALRITIRRMEATSLRLASGPFVLEIGRIALHQLVVQLRSDAGRLRLGSLEAADAELAGVKVHGPLVFPRPASGAAVAAEAAAGAWQLGPLAAADGRILGKIVDAHLLFDADVTIPMHQGQVDFNQATVEHVGPDSRMGVSRMGLYVDAPNGRSYLYQFPSTPAAGVEYERRGSLLGPRVADRGKLQLQPFAESVLRQFLGGQGGHLTEQARQLLDRTALSGEVQLGDGSFAAPGVQAEVAGRAQGRNAVRLRSEAVGRGLTLEMAALLVRNAVLQASGMRLACREATGVLLLRLFVEAAQLQFAFTLASMKVTGLRFDPHAPAGG
jgi:hypothetical protein